MRTPIAHTNREVINYKKVDPRNIVTLCQKACYNSSKESSTDERFLDFLSAGFVPHCALPQDKACCPNAVGSPRLYEEQEGYHLQHDS
jgi:hypothetical protein